MNLHRSPGITAIYNEIKISKKNRVLDLGPLSSGTFSFFSELSCKIHFESLDEFVLDSEGLTQQEKIELLESFLLEHDESEKFDLILSWDLFNYFEIDLVEVLLKKINPYCKPDTLLHMVKYLGPKVPVTPRRFNIRDKHYVSLKISDLVPRSVAQHQTAKLLKKMPEYYMHNTLVNMDGMLPGIAEHVLRFMPDKLKRRKHVSRTEVETKDKEDGNWVEHRSPAILEAIQYLKGTQHATVLDLGARCQSNVDVLRSHCEHVFAEDLYSSLRWRKSTQGDVSQTSALSPHALNFESSQKFDVILAWDLFNYCDKKQLLEIGEKLLQYSKENTRLIAFVYSGESIPKKPQQFRLSGEERVRVRPTEKEKRRFPVVTSISFMKLVPQFRSQKTYIFQPGMLAGLSELVFEHQQKIAMRPSKKAAPAV